MVRGMVYEAPARLPASSCGFYIAPSSFLVLMHAHLLPVYPEFLWISRRALATSPLYFIYLLAKAEAPPAVLLKRHMQAHLGERKAGRRGCDRPPTPARRAPATTTTTTTTKSRLPRTAIRTCRRTDFHSARARRPPGRSARVPPAPSERAPCHPTWNQRDSSWRGPGLGPGRQGGRSHRPCLRKGRRPQQGQEVGARRQGRGWRPGAAKGRRRSPAARVRSAPGPAAEGRESRVSSAQEPGQGTLERQGKHRSRRRLERWPERGRQERHRSHRRLTPGGSEPELGRPGRGQRQRKWERGRGRKSACRRTMRRRLARRWAPECSRQEPAPARWSEPALPSPAAVVLRIAPAAVAHRSLPAQMSAASRSHFLRAAGPPYPCPVGQGTGCWGCRVVPGRTLPALAGRTLPAPAGQTLPTPAGHPPRRRLAAHVRHARLLLPRHLRHALLATHLWHPRRCRTQSRSRHRRGGRNGRRLRWSAHVAEAREGVVDADRLRCLLRCRSRSRAAPFGGDARHCTELIGHLFQVLLLRLLLHAGRDHQNRVVRFRGVVEVHLEHLKGIW